MHGLDIVKVRENESVFLQRRSPTGAWQTATLELSKDSLAEVVAAVDDNRLFELRKEYHANVADGTQWVLWIKQGGTEKSVYFNNDFPKPIVRFAEQLDKVIADASPENLRWKTVSAAEAADHQKELWDSIK
jgi:hypothetical protein